MGWVALPAGGQGAGLGRPVRVGGVAVTRAVAVLLGGQVFDPEGLQLVVHLLE